MIAESRHGLAPIDGVITAHDPSALAQQMDQAIYLSDLRADDLARGHRMVIASVARDQRTVFLTGDAPRFQQRIARMRGLATDQSGQMQHHRQLAWAVAISTADTPNAFPDDDRASRDMKNHTAATSPHLHVQNMGPLMTVRCQCVWACTAARRKPDVDHAFTL